MREAVLWFLVPLIGMAAFLAAILVPCVAYGTDHQVFSIWGTEEQFEEVGAGTRDLRVWVEDLDTIGCDSGGSIVYGSVELVTRGTEKYLAGQYLHNIGIDHSRLGELKDG